MEPVLSREQMRAFDAHAIERCGVPSLLLMENAGRGAAELVFRVAAGRPGPVVVVCGAGNNGGDGFVVARLLAALGGKVHVVLVGDPARFTPDARTNHDAYVGVGGDVTRVGPESLDGVDRALGTAPVVVDAIFGTGLDRDVTGFHADVIRRMTASSALKVALDVPSGLHANTGRALGIALRADLTVTFAHRKLGLVTSSGAEHAGSVHVVDIGVPSLASLVGSSAAVLEASDVRAWLPARRVSAHKGDSGRVAILGGSPGKIGAALLAARGALRAGAGLVTLLAFPETADALDRRVLEEMTTRLDESRLEASLDEHLRSADAVVVGPGLGDDTRVRCAIDHVMASHPGLVVGDADALSRYAGRLPELANARGPRVLTPHPGEMGRLLGIETKDVEADRFGALARAVEASRAVVLLKGARTLVGAPGELPVVNPTGTPALATGGSGDVLSGILAALAAQLDDPRRAACAAAYLHGSAAEIWCARRGADRGMLAHEIADTLPDALAALTGGTVRLPV